MYASYCYSSKRGPKTSPQSPVWPFAMKVLVDQGPGHKSDNFHLLLMLVNFTAVHEAKAFYTYCYVK